MATEKPTGKTTANAPAAGSGKEDQPSPKLSDRPNADAVETGDGTELVRIDPAQNWRPADVARGGRHPGTDRVLSKEELADARKEMDELRARMAELEGILGTGVARRTFLMSEGTRQDVELHGHGVEPGTGESFTTDDLDRIPQYDGK